MRGPLPAPAADAVVDTGVGSPTYGRSSPVLLDDIGLAVGGPTPDPGGRPLAPSPGEKDTAAPTLAETRERGLLPTVEQVAGHLASLRSG